MKKKSRSYLFVVRFFLLLCFFSSLWLSEAILASDESKDENTSAGGGSGGAGSVLPVITGFVGSDHVKRDFFPYTYARSDFEFSEREGGSLCTEPSNPVVRFPEAATAREFSMPTKASSVETVLMKVIAGKDGRIPIDKPYSSLYRVHAQLNMTFGDSKYGGSGTLVGPRHILTAAHNVFSRDTKKWASKILVRVALDGKYLPFDQQKAVRVYTYRKWVNELDPSYDSADYDMALVVLDRDIGIRVGWYGLAYLPQIAFGEERHLCIAGYPKEVKGTDHSTHETDKVGEFRKMWRMSHKMNFIAPEKLYYDIDTSSGQSGSSIWYEEGDKRYIVGVHAYGQEKLGEGNFGVRITKGKFNDLVNWISETKSVHRITSDGTASVGGGSVSGAGAGAGGFAEMVALPAAGAGRGATGDTVKDTWDKAPSSTVLHNVPERGHSLLFHSESFKSCYNALHRTSHKGSKASLVTILGIKGVGKKTLAQHYVYEAYDNNAYDMIGWNPDKRWCDQLSPDKKFLIIYSDIKNHESLKGKIPRAGGHIIITSDNLDGWENVIELEHFTHDEAVDYLFRINRGFGKTEENKLLFGKVAENRGYLVSKLSNLTRIEERKRNGIRDLREANSFSAGHKAVAELSQLIEFLSYEEVKTVVQITLDNREILISRRDPRDIDTADFYSAIFEKNFESLANDIGEEAIRSRFHEIISDELRTVKRVRVG